MILASELPGTWGSDMTVILNRALLLILMLLPVAALDAQQPDASTQDQSAQDQNVSEEQSDDAAESNTEADADTDLPDIDSQPIESPQHTGPGRFIPSEQISQDFGVSFPVDI